MAYKITIVNDDPEFGYHVCFTGGHIEDCLADCLRGLESRESLPACAAAIIELVDVDSENEAFPHLEAEFDALKKAASQYIEAEALGHD